MNDVRVVRERLLQVYALYRTALMNQKYYGDLLTRSRRSNLAMECAVAVGTSGAIAAWAIWRGELGQYMWALIAGIATVLAVLKPLLQFPKQIERYGKAWTGHTELYLELKDTVSEIRVAKDFTQDMGTALRRAQERYRALSLDDDPSTNKKLLRRCYTEVITEIPVSTLWMPAEEKEHG